MIKLSHTITTGEAPEKVFSFFSNVDKYYREISSGHKKFELINGNSLAKGIFIDNEEWAKNYRIPISTLR